MTTDVAIVGAGPAGITAAIYALRAGIDVTVFEKNIYGGQTSIIENIENYPGFLRISGPDFSNALYEQAKNFGAKFVFSEVTDVDFSSEEKILKTSSGKTISAKSVIISNGLKRRTLGCIGEKEFFGKGVSYCATCDGAFFKDKSVAVVGGGNTALEDALYLSNICKNVAIIVRKNTFRAENILVQSVNNTENISVIFESNVKKIIGEKVVQKITIENKNFEISEIKIDGVFIAIGYEPDSKIYQGKIKIDDYGYFVAGEDCETSVEGVFVAGDCRAKPLRQIATAISDGAVAGSSASKFVMMKKLNSK